MPHKPPPDTGKPPPTKPPQGAPTPSPQEAERIVADMRRHANEQPVGPLRGSLHFYADKIEAALPAPTDQAGQEASDLRGVLPDEAVDLIESGQVKRPTHYHGPRLDDQAAQEAERCGIENTVYGYVCELEAGHSGPHIYSTDSGAYGWPPAPVATVKWTDQAGQLDAALKSVEREGEAGQEAECEVCGEQLIGKPPRCGNPFHGRPEAGQEGEWRCSECGAKWAHGYVVSPTKQEAEPTGVGQTADDPTETASELDGQKAERCGGTPGNPRYSIPGGWTSDLPGYLAGEASLLRCPGCPDCRKD